MKKILITGFSEFVAYHFLDYLNTVISRDEYIDVLGIDLHPNDIDKNHIFKNIHIHALSLNLMDFNALEVVIVSFSPDYILHLASLSSVSTSWKDPIGCFINNTNIFLNVVEAVKKSGCSCRILSIGSSEEYGNVVAKDVPISEMHELSPVSPYAIARVSQEMLSKCYVDSMGLDIVLTRSFNHIGPRQRNCFVIPSFIEQVLDGKRRGLDNIEISAGNLEIIRDFLDVRDVCRAYWLLLNKGFKGELYNVCSGKGHSLKSMLDLIADLAKVSVTVRVDRDKIRPNDNMIIIGDDSKICNLGDWKPKFELKKTLSDMIQYSQSQTNSIK